MKVSYKGGTQFTVEERGHNILVDLPPQKGGTDEGMTPPELLAAALGTCIGVYVTQACHQLKIDCEGTTVEIKHDIVQEPMRIGKLQATVHIPGGVPVEHIDKVKHAAENCLIHQTLCNQPELEIAIV